jgi:hypothetical protein
MLVSLASSYIILSRKVKLLTWKGTMLFGSDLDAASALETVIRNPRIHSFAIIFAMNENGVRKY